MKIYFDKELPRNITNILVRLEKDNSFEDKIHEIRELLEIPRRGYSIKERGRIRIPWGESKVMSIVNNLATEFKLPQAWNFGLLNLIFFKKFILSFRQENQIYLELVRNGVPLRTIRDPLIESGLKIVISSKITITALKRWVDSHKEILESFMRYLPKTREPRFDIDFKLYREIEKLRRPGKRESWSNISETLRKKYPDDPRVLDYDYLRKLFKRYRDYLKPPKRLRS